MIEILIKLLKILIECKSPNIHLSQKSLDQLLIYNMKLNSKYLMLSNGLRHIFMKFETSNFTTIKNLPTYSEL